MSTEIDTVRKFYDIFASGEVDRFDEVLAPNWQLLPALFGSDGTVSGEKQTVSYLHSVASDITYTVEEIHDCGDGTVACRNLLKGRQTGPFLGLSATGAPFELMTMELHHLTDGRIDRTWHLEDFFGMQQQLLAAGAEQLPPEAPTG